MHDVLIEICCPQWPGHRSNVRMSIFVDRRPWSSRWQRCCRNRNTFPNSSKPNGSDRQEAEGKENPMETAENLRLDGNAAAGLLSEVFGQDATEAMARCGGCGMEGEVGALMAYMHGMGSVLRCPHCDQVLI